LTFQRNPGDLFLGKAKDISALLRHQRDATLIKVKQAYTRLNKPKKFLRVPFPSVTKKERGLFHRRKLGPPLPHPFSLQRSLSPTVITVIENLYF
jgi:hypothetical protein